MKNKLLFPTFFKWIGLVLLLLFSASFIAWNNYNFEFSLLKTNSQGTESDLASVFDDHNLTNELIGAGLLTGLVFIAFAREKTEDERTTLIRLQSLQLSHYLSYLFFALILFMVNGFSFLLTMIYLPYLSLITFILVYYCRLYLLPKFTPNEE